MLRKSPFARTLPMGMRCDRIKYLCAIAVTPNRQKGSNVSNSEPQRTSKSHPISGPDQGGRVRRPDFPSSPASLAV
jgi:hypothetical protein